MWSWDEEKRQSNLRKHGADFSDVARFEWASATVDPDRRRDYGEERFIALGLLEGRLHVLIFTRRGRSLRLISLLKANQREVQQWSTKRSGDNDA